MKRTWGVVLVSLLVAACGGGSGSKGAASPSSVTGTSQLSITTLAKDGSGVRSKFAISGPTYGVFDAASGGFHIFIVDSSHSGAAPDCDHLKEIATGSGKARIVDLYFDKNITAPGNVDALGALAIDATGDAPEMSQAKVDDVTVDFKSVDAKSFDGDVVSASGLASGSLHGAICDASKLRGPAGGDASVNAQVQMGPAPTTHPTGPTEFAIEVETSPGSRATTAVSGTSIAKLDPKAKILAIATWPDLSPFPQDPPAAIPSCDVFADAHKSLGKNGNVTILYAKSGKHAAGKYDVYAAQSFLVMSDPPEDVQTAGGVVASVDVSKFDGKDFTAKYVSTARLNDEKETIGGTVCPDGHFDAPAAPKTKSAKGEKKKK